MPQGDLASQNVVIRALSGNLASQSAVNPGNLGRIRNTAGREPQVLSHTTTFWDANPTATVPVARSKKRSQK
jgi:hypothetical protein